MHVTFHNKTGLKKRVKKTRNFAEERTSPGIIPAGAVCSCGSGETSAVFSLGTYLSSTNCCWQHLVSGPRSLHLLEQEVQQPPLQVPTWGWGASSSPPHTLVIMPVKGQWGSPLSFLIKAALAENPKKEEAPQWVRAEGALRLPWLPAGTCVRSPALRSQVLSFPS